MLMFLLFVLVDEFVALYSVNQKKTGPFFIWP